MVLIRQGKRGRDGTGKRGQGRGDMNKRTGKRGQGRGDIEEETQELVPPAIPIFPRASDLGCAEG